MSHLSIYSHNSGVSVHNSLPCCIYFFFFPSHFPLQLPEPLILFRYYNDFIGLAKESQSIIVEELEALRLSPTSVAPAQVSVELNRVLFKIKDLLKQLPPAHYKTLQFLIEHLHRYGNFSQTHFCSVHCYWSLL